MTQVHPLFADRGAIAAAVATAKSRRHALTMLGIQPGPLNYRRLAEACRAYGLTEVQPFARDRDRTEKKCNGCGRTLPMERFAWRDETTGRRQSRCRSCHSGLRRDHYERNRPKILRQVATRNREVRERNVRAILAYLAENPCVDCGEADPLVLRFDHVTGTKTANISNMMFLAKWTDVLAEIAKCVVRCANCHTRRTAAQFGWLRAVLAQPAGHLPSKQA